MSQIVYSDRPGWSHCVWCEGCQQHHGPIYICDTYTEDYKAMLRVEHAQWQRLSADPVWQEEQRQRGIPDEVIAINQALAGG